MITDSWLQPHLDAVLRNRLSVLKNWRGQANLQGRIKNPENWILVELTHQLLETQFARVVLTNGFFADGTDSIAPKRVRASDVPNLQGSASKARYISADLSVKRASDDAYLIAELKTGVAAVELLDDLRRVRFYRSDRIAKRAELGWVVILPEKEEDNGKAFDAGRKTMEKICSRLESEPGGCTLLSTNIEDWLIGWVAIPRSI